MENLEKNIEAASIKDKNRLILNLGIYIIDTIKQNDAKQEEIMDNTEECVGSKAYATGYCHASIRSVTDLTYIMIKMYNELGLDKIYKESYDDMVKTLKVNADFLKDK